MRHFAILSFILFLGLNLAAQSLPEFELKKSEVEFQLRFLASDELQGRATGSEGINIAARFISEQFRRWELQYAPNMDSYFQPIDLASTQPPAKGQIKIGETIYLNKENALILTGKAVDFSVPAIFAGHGWISEDGTHNDYHGVDVKGKVVVVLPGMPDSSNPRAIFQTRNQKIQMAADQGAVGIIELFRVQFPWEYFLRFSSRENLRVLDPVTELKADIPYALLKEEDEDLVQLIKDNKEIKVQIKSSGIQKRKLDSKNIVGIVEGTDPSLKNEYILVSAHYDHLGIRSNGPEEDSIYNGARDNAMGCVALMAAAQALAKKPAKRPVIFLLVTGEEMGLIGSKYYASHPLIPLEQTIFNLNSDNAGYSDTSLVSIVGYGRTGTDDLVKKGIEAAGLNVFPDPAPEQGLFDRSDNVSFAIKGIPCITFSGGFTSFDQEINKYYHKAGDDPDSIDFDYMTKFCQALAHTTRLLADSPSRPKWKAGDKYEEAGKVLYREK